MKTLVVIGGGFAGAKIAKSLESKFNTILIDTKDHFEFTPSILRTLINPKKAKKIQILHKDHLKKTKIIQDKVIKTNKKFILTKKGKKINFDYLVIASGSSYNMPFKEKDVILTARSESLIKYNKKLEDAKRIAIIGGGIVGVELAAEITVKYKNKKICLIHSHDRLMERSNIKSSRYAEEFLRKHGIKLILKDKAKNKKGDIILTSNGKKIKTDVTFLCVGIRPNSTFLDKKLVSALNNKKAIKVNKYLQVEGCKNVFAAGDITNIKEEKTAQAAEKQADIVIKNIQCVEKNKKLKEYISKKLPMIISLGKYNAIFENKSFVITGLIPAFMKYLVEKKTMLRYK